MTLRPNEDCLRAGRVQTSYTCDSCACCWWYWCCACCCCWRVCERAASPALPRGSVMSLCVLALTVGPWRTAH